MRKFYKIDMELTWMVSFFALEITNLNSIIKFIRVENMLYSYSVCSNDVSFNLTLAIEIYEKGYEIKTLLG